MAFEGIHLLIIHLLNLAAASNLRFYYLVIPPDLDKLTPLLESERTQLKLERPDSLRARLDHLGGSHLLKTEGSRPGSTVSTED